MMEKIYYPYPAKDATSKRWMLYIHKCYVITKSGENIYFGQYSASDLTIHEDEERKKRCIEKPKCPMCGLC